MHLYLFTYRPTIVLYIRAQYLLENLVDVSFQTHNLYSKRSMPAFLSKKTFDTVFVGNTNIPLKNILLMARFGRLKVYS